MLLVLLHALRFPQAWRQAATAFRGVCARCSGALREPAALGRLIELAAAAVAPPPAPGQPAQPTGARALTRPAGLLARRRAHRLRRRAPF